MTNYSNEVPEAPVSGDKQVTLHESPYGTHLPSYLRERLQQKLRHGLLGEDPGRLQPHAWYHGRANDT